MRNWDYCTPEMAIEELSQLGDPAAGLGRVLWREIESLRKWAMAREQEAARRPFEAARQFRPLYDVPYQIDGKMEYPEFEDYERGCREEKESSGKA